MIFSYEEAVEKGVGLVGGKGFNLGKLKRYGFSVPDGFIISAEFYKKIIDDTNIKNKMDHIVQQYSKSPDNKEINNLLTEIQQLIIDYDNSELENIIKNALDKFKLENSFVAVRSSATTEDSKEISFAGIHSSYLKINGYKDITDSVKKCYASLWTLQALAYRHNKKIDYQDVLCAVVICKMLEGVNGEPEFAGVAFSIDPLTGKSNQIKINSTTGLAEKLVSGDIIPEEITVIESNNKMSVEYKKGQKGRFLSEDKVLLLARIVQRIFWDIGNGQIQQDIEWAYDGNKFWIVQARPITNYKYLTYKELEKMPIIWTNANFKDVVPGLISPATYSGLTSILKHIMYVSVEASGFNPLQGIEIVRRFDGRMYFDLGFMQWSLYKSLGTSPHEINESLGGLQPEINVPALTFLEKLAQGNRAGKLIKKLFKAVKEIQNEYPLIKKYVYDFENVDLTNYSNEQLLSEINLVSSKLFDYGVKFQLSNAYSSFTQVPLKTILNKLIPEKSLSVFSGLMAGTNNIESAEQGYRIYDLARIAKIDNQAMEFFKSEPFLSDKWKYIDHSSIFYKEFRKYLDEFGHRTVYEGDIANPRWREEPSFILEQVKQLLNESEIINPREKALLVRKKAEEEIDKLPFFIKPIIKRLAEFSRKGAFMREKGKSGLNFFVLPQRKLLLEIGNRLLNKGLLEKKQDIFFLTTADINSYLNDDWNGNGISELVSDRKKQKEDFSLINPPDVIITDHNGNIIENPSQISFKTEFVSKIKKDKNSTIIKGIGVAPGIVTGKVRIIKNPSESQKLLTGEIMVAPSTDPGWTPLFLKSSGLVIEIGGYLSHGSIVAREYGIPTVVNIPDIMSLLQDGPGRFKSNISLQIG